MRKKTGLNLSIKDYRLFLNDSDHMKEPYFLLIELGGNVFTFSNKKKAQRWLSTFKRQSLDLYVELGLFLPKIYEIQLSTIKFNDHSTFEKNMNELNYYTIRHSKIQKGILLGDIHIGKEVYNLHSLIIDQLIYLKKILQVNNRNQNLLEKVKIHISQLSRLMNQFKQLFSSEHGIKKIENYNPNIDSYLRIA